MAHTPRRRGQSKAATGTDSLSKAQVAQRLGISVDSVHRRIKDGTLPAFKVGGLVRIRAEDVEALRAGGAK